MLLLLILALGGLVLLGAMAVYGVGPELALQTFYSDVTYLLLILPWLFVALSIGLFLKSKLRRNELTRDAQQTAFPLSKVLITFVFAVLSTVAIRSINGLLS